MSGTSMSREMALLVEAFGYGWADLQWFTINAMKSAFIPFDERLALINEVIKPAYAKLLRLIRPANPHWARSGILDSVRMRPSRSGMQRSAVDPLRSGILVGSSADHLRIRHLLPDRIRSHPMTGIAPVDAIGPSEVQACGAST